MQAITTDIIALTQKTDIQMLQPKSLQNDYFQSGKSFSDILSARMNEAEKSVEKEMNFVSDSSELKSVNQEKSINDDKNDEVQNPKQSDDVKETKAEDEKENEKSDAEENLSYMRLDLIKDENTEAQKTLLEEKDGLEKVSNEIFDKLESADDEERIRVLTSSVSNVKSDFDFEVEDVSSEALALESAQGNSVENPELFLNRMEIQINDINSENLNKIKTENSSVSEKTKSKLTVTDLRTEKTESNAQKNDAAEPKLKVTTVIDSSDSATITMNLNQSTQNAAQDILSLNSQTAAQDGSNFQAMLSNQIQSNASEFVKASNIILKDNDKGTINLVLHPDDLGDVKFHLSLDGNKISGHITVNTKEALQVFRDNAETLREAFIRNGFENAGFEVSYNFNGNSGNNDFEQQNQNSNNVFARKEYGALQEVSVSQVESSEFDNYGEFNINIVA